MVRHGIKLKSWAFSAVLVLIFTIVAMAATFQNYIGKTAKQLSGMSAGKVDIASSTYWYNKVYTPMQSIVQRLNRYRYAADYASNLSAAVDSGGVVTFMPQDTINVEESLDVGSNIALIGYGESSVLSSTKDQYTAGMPVINCEDDSNIIIQGIHFKPDSNYAFMIEHDHCINLVRCKNVVITNCIFDCVGDGVCLSMDADGNNVPNKNIIITNNIFRGGYYDPDHWALPCSRNGVSLIHARGVIISNNTFEGFNGPGCIDFEPNSGYDNFVYDVTVSDNVIYNLKHGIIVVGPNVTNIDAIHNVSITGNTIIGTNYDGVTQVGSGIWIEHYVKGLTISNNTISNQTYADYPGLFVRHPMENTLISSNIINGCTQHGIQTMGSPCGVTIANNHVSGNGGVGIYVYSEQEVVTSTRMSGAGFETITAWTESGTAELVRSSTYKYGGTYSGKVTTNANGDGIWQKLTTVAADTDYMVQVQAYCYVTDSHYDGKYTGRVKMEVRGSAYNQIIAWAGESDFDSSWVEFGCIFRPSLTDTLVIYSNEDMEWYVDRVILTRLHASTNLSIIGNQCFNNGSCGIQVDFSLNSTINDNHCYNLTNDTNRTQITGLYVKGGVNSSILGNRGENNISYDLYLTDIYGGELSVKGGIKKYGANLKYCSFPFAKAITFFEDSLAAGEQLWKVADGGTGTRQMYMAPTSGSIVGLSGYFTKEPTDPAGMRIYPIFGDSVSYDVHNSGGDAYLVMDGRSQSNNFLTDMLDFRKGEMLSIMIESGSSFVVPESTGIFIMMLFE